MGRLRVLSAQELCKILEQQGFSQVRQRGSHTIMQKRTDNSTITVPVPSYAEIRVGMQSIIRQSGLPRSLFETA